MNVRILQYVRQETKAVKDGGQHGYIASPPGFVLSIIRCIFFMCTPHGVVSAAFLPTQMTMQTALEGAVYSALSAARTRADTDQVAALENLRDWLDYDSTNATLTEMTAKADFLRNNLGVPVNTD